MESFRSEIRKFQSNLWGYHFLVPDPIANKFIEGTDRRVSCRLNDTVEIHSALMASNEGWFILMNDQLRKKLRLTLGSPISVSMEKDQSEYGMPMPEELDVLLQQDEEGNELFHALTPGKQRNLIYIVSKVKNTHSRLNKALAILEHLKERSGKLDFKLLNEKIKLYNQRGKLNN